MNILFQVDVIQPGPPGSAQMNMSGINSNLGYVSLGTS